MNLAELRDEVAFRLNFNDGQVDQGFSTKRLNKIINQAYRREVNRAQQEGKKEWFKRTVDVTWPKGLLEFELPPNASQRGIYKVFELVDGKINREVFIKEDPEYSGYANYSLGSTVNGFYDAIFWKDLKTLSFGTQEGPKKDIDLRILYMATAETLEKDGDEPLLIPEQYQEVIVLAAATIARNIADEATPAAWLAELEDLRFDYEKFISQGRPLGQGTEWFEGSGIDGQGGHGAGYASFGGGSSCPDTAVSISYDPTSVGKAATDVQAAIDDLYTTKLDNASILNDLGDVEVTGVNAGQYLAYNGVNWVPVTPVVNSTLYEAYEAGVTVLASGVYTTVDLDTDAFPNPGFVLAAGVVTVATGGLYKINYSVSTDSTDGTRANTQCALFINGIELTRSRAYNYNRSTANGEDTATKSVLVTLSDSDTVEIRALILGNGVQTIADASNLVMERKS